MPEKLKLADASTVIGFEAGETIVREGEAGNDFFIIKKGEVKIFQLEANGAQKTVFYKYQGDWFGEEAMSTGLPHTATVVAASKGQERTEVLKVNKRTFMKLLGPIRDVLERSERKSCPLMHSRYLSLLS